MWNLKDLKPLVYTLYIYKQIFFLIWDLKPFIIYILCFQEKKLYFQCGIRNSLVYILYVHKKKIMFIQCGMKKNFD
jgi:hypothetical protein